MGHLQEENAEKEEGSPNYMALTGCYEVSKIVAFYLTIMPAIKSNDIKYSLALLEAGYHPLMSQNAVAEAKIV